MSVNQPVAWAVLVLSLVGAAGLALASVKVRGVGLGIAGVLFAGILIGHFGIHIDHGILEFVREFGLILFVFTIGLQLGPGFFASLRREGLKFNLLAAAVIFLGVALTLGLAKALGIDLFAAIGLFTGATTNTPSLGAAQQAMNTLNTNAERAALPALAYAVAYPGGVFGIIATLLVLRFAFKIQPEAEAEAYRAEQRKGASAVERMNLIVENPNLENLAIANVPGRRETGVIISRIQRTGESEVRTATEQTILRRGDIILAVGPRQGLERFRVIVGRESEVNLIQTPGQVASLRIVATRKEVLGRTLGELALDARFGVIVTRITRADLEMTALPELRLQFGDMLQIVGAAEALPKAAQELGNSPRALNETNFTPIFIGIALGVLAGMLPIAIPGMPVPVKLGLAGGPLILAIILGRIGRIGPFLWYMPANANLAFRELGIVLFLACVGLKAGEKFFSTVFTPQGLTWLLAGLAITVVPLLVIGVIARLSLRMNYTAISGLLAGSMTDPPALAFANAICKSDAPSVAYATVYPLTMLLRIVAVQILVLMFGR